MSKSMFLIQGNLCAERVRLGRALHKPPLTQEELARKIQFMGEEGMTKLIISRIEQTSAMSVMLNCEYWQKLWVYPWNGWLVILMK